MRRKDLFSFGNTPAERSAARLLFLIGLGSSTQINIGGYTAISELLLVLLMPIALAKNFSLFKKDHSTSLLWLLIVWGVGQLLIDISVDNYFAFMIRGLIPPVGIFAALVTIYPLLRRNPEGLKWILLGMALSGIISIFIFQHGSDIDSDVVRSGRMTAVEAIVGYKLFWVSKLNEWLAIPVKGWFMLVPHNISIAIAAFLAIFGLASGGRSSFLSGCVTVLLMWIGGKTSKKMLWMKRNWPILLAVLVVMMPLVKFTYQYAASSGWMGEQELKKYEEQSKGKSGFETLKEGRSEFFIALDAILDKPIFGHGSYALDHRGYSINFFINHGVDEETLKRMQFVEKISGVRPIPAHSHIAQFWLWAGVFGLLPWVYLLWLFAKTLFVRMHVYPSYYGYLVLTLPGVFWAIFFSPLGSRINMAVLISVCFVVRSIEREQRRMNGFAVKAC